MYLKIKNNLRHNLILYYLVVSGFLIRLIFASFPGFKIDVDSWFAWSLRLQEVGFSKFYEPDYFADYPPGLLYLLYGLANLKILFNLSTPSYYFLLKLPSILAEVLIAVFAYKIIAKKVSERWGYAAFFGILFNPGLIFNSSIWGQGEAILTFLLLLVVLFLHEKKYILSSLFIGGAFLAKPQTISLFPLFLLFLIKNHFKWGIISKLFFPGFIVIFLLQLPFFSTNPILGLPQLLINTASQYTSTSLFAYNFWGVVGFWIEDSTKFFGFSYQGWSIFLFLFYWLIVGTLFLKVRQANVFIFATLAFLGFFFLPTRVHERYLYPAIPFLFIAASLLKSSFIYCLTIILSFIYLINLYQVYVYYNEIYLKLPKLLYIEGFFEILELNSKILSLISTLLFGLITIIIFKFVWTTRHDH